MAQMNLIVTPAFEAALERIMRRRGFANKSEAVRTVIEEAAQLVEASEALRQRERERAIEEAHGLWAGQGPDLPRFPDGSANWGAWKDEMYEGMP